MQLIDGITIHAAQADLLHDLWISFSNDHLLHIRVGQDNDDDD
jgi:hypothetical protein